jgi:hypothetical protein
MKNKRLQFSLILAAAGLAFAVMLAVPQPAKAAATIVILNADGAGEGFNDPTPAAPVGGNTGTTLGQQRLIAFQAAASIWGAQLSSAVPILIRANFDPLSCTASSAVLGSAGPTEIWSAPSFPFPNTWYHKALANKLSGLDLDPATPDIAARFNSNLGNTGCLTGTFFYLGLDNNHGFNIDLVTVLLHEFSHGLGFSTVTNGSTGAYIAGLPSAFDHFLYDLTAGKLWIDMTNAERAASALNSRKLVWNGANVTSNVPLVLAAGTPLLSVSAPPSYGGTGVYQVGTASFGPPLSSPGLTGEIMPVVDTSAAGPACTPLNAANALAVNGKFALIDRGICGFTVKVKNAQNAGAIGVIIADNVAGSPPAGLGGADPTITIPAVRISLADANILKSALRYRSRTRSGVVGTMEVNMSVRSGADPIGRALLYTPNPFQSGSSVSHWDTIAFPNLLMEPNINGDLTHSVTIPQDLTLPLLTDVGW